MKNTTPELVWRTCGRGNVEAGSSNDHIYANTRIDVASAIAQGNGAFMLGGSEQEATNDSAWRIAA
jgi:hypothetical protein